MPPTLKEHLLKMTEQRFQETLKTLETVTKAQAERDRRADWPSHKNYVGQDGSISGIVHHMAAWKQAFAEYLRGNVVDYRTVGPQNPTWEELRAWLAQTGQEWLTAATAVPEAEMETPLSLPGLESEWWYTPLNMMQELLDHETEHLGQIHYLIEAQRCSPE